MFASFYRYFPANDKKNPDLRPVSVEFVNSIQNRRTASFPKTSIPVRLTAFSSGSLGSRPPYSEHVAEAVHIETVLLRRR